MKDWSCVNLKLFLDCAVNPLICNDFLLEGALALMTMPCSPMEGGASRARQQQGKAGKNQPAMGYFSFNAIRKPAKKAG
ncbi:MAG: hypothetical protein A3E79_13310 [Burkholderiales bacterium RIFCSPHIGHO2_12_FULL_61_11]|nr:MAG: hypothetical protein A3E79_13310 [Burkholderiales bacterium RIFCSPHIGHO2_12_FULL_61_11]